MVSGVSGLLLLGLGVPRIAYHPEIVEMASSWEFWEQNAYVPAMHSALRCQLTRFHFVRNLSYELPFSLWILL